MTVRRLAAKSKRKYQEIRPAPAGQFLVIIRICNQPTTASSRPRAKRKRAIKIPPIVQGIYTPEDGQGHDYA
jgi:hypothetical protein